MATGRDFASGQYECDGRLDKLEAEILKLKRSLSRPPIERPLATQRNTKFGTTSTSLLSERNKAAIAPLFRVAIEGDKKALLQLLEKGEYIYQRNYQGDTALHVAASAGLRPIVDVLLRRECAVDIRGHRNRSPLLCAAAQGHERVVRRLIIGGANVHARDSAGNSALHLAARAGHLDVARVLYVYNASLDVTDSEGNSAVVLAAKAKQWKMVIFLLQRGAS